MVTEIFIGTDGQTDIKLLCIIDAVIIQVSKSSEGSVSSSLSVENIDWQDSGVYQCKASERENGLIEGDVAQLVVHSKPKNSGKNPCTLLI